jgi:hypothetical protein
LSAVKPDGRQMAKIVTLTSICLLFANSCFGANTYNMFTVNQEIIDGIADRFDSDSLTEYDKITLKRIYRNMIFFGGLVFPEASKILRHYLFGNGDDLEIVSRYFFNSKVVADALSGNPNTAIIGPVTLRIGENPRSAYAVNGFYISNDGAIEVFQKIDFADRNNRNAYTTFNVLGRELKIPDRLVRAFEESGGCKPFTVRIHDRN